MLKTYDDFPYRNEIVPFGDTWNYGINYEKLDYRKINHLRNKAFIFSFKSKIHIGISEESDKEIEEKLDGVIELKSLLSQIETLPILENRKEIFLELMELYNSGMYYGFYALALPQVEGIFSEMLQIISTKRSSQSLTEKANSIRPFLEESDHFMDYYEHVLPNQRNKFSHFGKDEKIETKSKYLLLDLIHVVSLFGQLQTPLIQLTNSIKAGIGTFSHIGHLTYFLKLVKDVQHNDQINLFKMK